MKKKITSRPWLLSCCKVHCIDTIAGMHFGFHGTRGWAKRWSYYSIMLLTGTIHGSRFGEHVPLNIITVRKIESTRAGREQPVGLEIVNGKTGCVGLEIRRVTWGLF
jgi:hypothetical protein